MSYYEKYLKYKSKYLQLTKLIGGGKQSAMDMFLARFNDDVKKILINDRSRRFIYFDGEPSKENLKSIFEQIYTKVESDNKNIDWIIKSYINNTFGKPSSLENYGRFKNAISKYNMLKANIDGIKPIADINGLLELEDFIEMPINLEYFESIEEKKAKQKKKVERGKEVVQGIDDKETILETDKVIIYKPTTEAGSKYYGRNTRWCTAASENCMFDYYNKEGSLYIIQSKEDSKLKFQLHVETDSLMDDKDNPVTIEHIKRTFRVEKNDPFDNWLDGIWEKTIIDNFLKTNEIIINYGIELFNIDSNKLRNLFVKVNKLKSLTIGSRFDKPLLGDLLKGLTSLQSLTLNNGFIQPLDSLKSLTNLQSLTFGIYFDQPLGDLLKGLTNLQSLTLRNNFDKPLGDLLKGLTNLQSLTFGNYFNQPLGDSLKDLTNLKSLTFENFNKKLGDSLKGLTNLQSLTFRNNFDQPLGDSLKYLNNLQSLTFGSYFDQPLGDSLKGLTNLQSLTFRYYFNQPLGDSLKGLTSLQSLDFFGTFDQPLGDSLKGLTSLQSLTFGNYFNQPLGDSLKGLTSLQSVTFGHDFNKSLVDSLKYSLKDLPNLKTVNGKPYP